MSFISINKFVQFLISAFIWQQIEPWNSFNNSFPAAYTFKFFLLATLWETLPPCRSTWDRVLVGHKSQIRPGITNFFWATGNLKRLVI
jgi:hypothetical protein